MNPHGSTLLEGAPARLEARPAVRALPTSKIREIANAGFGKTDLVKFWFGESDAPTPDFIKAAAIEALNADAVFYSHNNGVAPLREALADYLGGLHGKGFSPAQISVTSSGVSALMIATQALVSPGDEVVVITPVWPNVTQIPAILNARVTRFALSPSAEGWKLDLDRLLASVTSKTRLLVLNSPGNPTGWTIEADDQKAILEHCRKLGVWILCDDVYERLTYRPGPSTAPSFLRITEREDRVISANSFSKAWLMTGWRLGWLVAPPELEEDLGKLIEFNTSCSPVFVQAAGIVALRDGESFVAGLRDELRAKRDFLTGRLGALKGVVAPPPEGGMYAFFRIEGEDDSVALARRLMEEARIGLAPGAAFGPEGEGWLRWCFAVSDARLQEGVRGLEAWLSARAG